MLPTGRLGNGAIFTKSWLMSKKSAVNPPTTLLCDRVKVPLSCPVSPQMEGSHPTAEDSSPKGTFLPYFPLTFPCFALPQREATATNLMEESLRYIETQYLQWAGPLHWKAQWPVSGCPATCSLGAGVLRPSPLLLCLPGWTDCTGSAHVPPPRSG